MTVKKRLTQMSDAGQFETLVTSILRRADPHYESVIQTGVNSEGKPIQDPVDGIGWVRGSEPPHYVFFEYTTRKKNGLESKWLSDPDADSSQSKGDLIKAAERAEEIRCDSPEAEFTVVLVSNRDLSSDLVTKAKNEAEERDLSIDIWSVHELSDFLQNDPDGQWIRQQHFGIEAERLSKPLLLKIAQENLEAYQEEFRVEMAELRIKRSELSTILDTAESVVSRSYLIPLIGNSGFGKTVTSYQAMESWLSDGKPAFRLTPTDIEKSASISQALQSGLKRNQSSLSSRAGQEAIQIAQKNDSLLLVVDDLNRANDPSHLFKRISNWMGETRDNDEGKSEHLPVVIVCPLWPRIWTRQKRDVRYNKFAEPVELGPFSSDTAVRLIQSQATTHGVNISEEIAQDLAEKVGGDPHIIGLLGRLIEREENIENLPEASKDVIQEYVDDSYETASENSSKSLVPADYDLAVERLSLNILQMKNLEPAWRSVCDWVTVSEHLQALRELTKQAQLLFIHQKQSDQVLSYRHNRLRDYLLASHSLKRIADGEDISYLDDPYYYSILGQGIAYFRPSEDVIGRLCKENPLALFEGLRELGGDSQTYENILRQEIQEWFDEQGGSKNLPPSFLDKATEILQETDSPEVLEVTKEFPDRSPVLLARFRNGDLEAGIQFCNQGRSGSPNTNFSQRDSIMKQVQTQWGGQYPTQLSDRLSSIDQENVSGALQLSGFIGESVIIPGIEDVWANFGNEDHLLPAFIWASFQCGIPDETSLVDTIFSHWASLPSANKVDNGADTDSASDGQVTKGEVFSRVKFALTRDLSQDQIQYLIDAIDEFPDLEIHLLGLLKQVADPDALEIVVRKFGEYQQEAEGHGPVHLIHNLTQRWDPTSVRGRTLPNNCKTRLRAIWSNDGETDEIRRLAFRIWSGSAQESELEVLREASENELFEYYSHYRRLELGDNSVLRSSVIDVVETPGYLPAVPKAWGSEAHELIDDILTNEEPDEGNDLFYQLARLMFRIPSDDAEELLTKHWEKIGDDPDFFQAALYTATPETRDLAKKAYSESDNPSALLGRVRMNFGFNTYGRSEFISKEQLVSLKPYLDDIAEMDLVEIAQKAKEMGLTDWSGKHIQPLLSDEHRYQAHPTDEDLFERLDEIEADDDYQIEIKVWMDDFERRAESITRAFRILEKWLKKEPKIVRYNIVAEAIKNWGTRKDLSILDEVALESDDEDVQKSHTDAKFGVEVRSLK